MIRQFFNKLISTIWSFFLNGLLTLLPITITFGIFSFTFKLLKSWLAPLRTCHECVPYLKDIPHAEIFLAIGFIFFAGIVLKSFIIRSLINFVERIVEHVPLVHPVYTGVKQLVKAFSPDDALTFKQVVLVEFPRPGMFSIGFQTSELAKELSPDTQHIFYNVFIPTTPNPTTGYFIVVKKQDFRPVNLTTQEAMALIISGGIIQPERYERK